jgi:putative transposase
VNGRKRHLVVDTLGLIHALTVHEADIQDGLGAWWLLAQLWERFPRLQKLWADSRYASLVGVLERQFACELEIVKRSPEARGFEVLPHRWIVERTFGWFGRYRRLSKDYEAQTSSSEAMIYLAMTHLMLRRLRPT